MAAAKATADKIAAATHDADSFTAAVTANVPAKESGGRHDHCAERHGQYRHQGARASAPPCTPTGYSADRHANDVTVVEQGEQRLLRRALREPR